MVQLASANVSSLQGIWDLLVELPFDVLAMQEMHIRNILYWKARATKAGMQLVVGEPGHDGQYLVGFLLRRGTLCALPFSAPLDKQRVLMATWHFDEGPPLIVANDYGHVTPTAQQQEDLGNTLGAFLEH